MSDPVPYFIWITPTNQMPSSERLRACLRPGRWITIHERDGKLKIVGWRKAA
jgi:hypothetical protein